MTEMISPDSRLGHLILQDNSAEISSIWPDSHTVFITDEHVRKAHPFLFDFKTTVVLKPGEQNKTLDTIRFLYQKFLQYHVDRTWHIVGIGGGVICDLTGFAAATFMRGLPFSFVPTTLLAQVDAAVGGKNGCNYQGYKNLAGTFAIPQKVIFNFELLKTLPRSEITNGIAEIVKHACIADASLFNFLEIQGTHLFHLEKEAVKKSVAASLAAKSDIVKMDLTDQGTRHILNFGHTFGHAIESRYGLSHGESVSLGMRTAVFISHALGRLKEADCRRINRLMDQLQLPARHDMDAEKIMDAVLRDKKRQRDRIRFVCLSGIGRADIIPLQVSQIRIFFEQYSSAAASPEKGLNHD